MNSNILLNIRNRRGMTTNRDIYKAGHLTAKPKTDTATGDFTRGLHPLQLSGRRDGYVYVPAGYNHSQPAALVVMLHGAGGKAEQGLSLLQQYADDYNIILIAPASRAPTWDIIASESFDHDVIYIDQALALAFETYTIDPDHIAIGGFSDGASYGLCIGLSNGDLFTHILAFSPGFAYTVERKGKPAVFISHGIKDTVLPIDPCSRRVVAQLQRQDYSVNYKEFSGGHEIPDPISKKAVEWLLNNKASAQ